MPTDPHVDAYIAAQQPFARPILAHLRTLVHEIVPEAAETIKWSRPFFLIDARPFCFLAAFKAHAAFGFWQGLAPTGREEEAAGSFGRLRSLADLPSDAALRAMLAEAAVRARADRPPRARAAPRPPLPIPAELAEALAARPEAAAHFDGLAASHKRDYAEWVGEAKRADTRARRIAATIEKLAAGETLNARYGAR